MHLFFSKFSQLFYNFLSFLTSLLCILLNIDMRYWDWYTFWPPKLMTKTMNLNHVVNWPTTLLFSYIISFASCVHLVSSFRLWLEDRFDQNHCVIWSDICGHNHAEVMYRSKKEWDFVWLWCLCLCLGIQSLGLES